MIDLRARASYLSRRLRQGRFIRVCRVVGIAFALVWAHSGGACRIGWIGLDWMVPEAWNVEHNNRHYYHYLSELTDPDLVEANLSQLQLRDMPIPLLLK
jgi:hypothetical protein